MLIIIIIMLIVLFAPGEHHATGVCEINTRLDVAGVFSVPTPLHSFQSRRQGSPTAADKTECLFHRPSGRSEKNTRGFIQKSIW